jgi:surface antigen
MPRLPRLALAALMAVGLASCASSGYGQKQTVGAIAGAGAGGLLGAQFGHGPGQLAATAAGTLAGALLGGAIGKSLDQTDQLYANSADYHALEYAPSGTVTSWQNPDSGHSGSVVPTRTYETTSGEYCREFQQQAAIGGQVQEVYGTACRQPDGQWKLVSGG